VICNQLGCRDLTLSMWQCCAETLNSLHSLEGITHEKWSSKYILHLYYQCNENTLLWIGQNSMYSLIRKVNELICFLNHDLPPFISISEHHLNNCERDYIHLPNYKLGAKYCRKSSPKGGVCIFIHNNIKFHVINLDSFCRDKHTEVGAIKLQLNNINTYVLTVYRAPSGNFDHFLNKLDTILKTLLHPNFEYIICGDFNINYRTDNPNKKLLDSLLNSYNFTSIVHFPTRIQSKSLSAIDNIFIDYSRKDKNYICPFFQWSIWPRWSVVTVFQCLYIYLN
jgi:exonuclease III